MIWHFGKSYLIGSASDRKDARAAGKGPGLKALSAGLGLRLILTWLFALLTIRLSLSFADLPFHTSLQALTSAFVIVLISLIFWNWRTILIFFGACCLLIVAGWTSGYFLEDRFHGFLTDWSFWFTEAFYWLIAQPNQFPESSLPMLSLFLGGLIAAACAIFIVRVVHPWLMLLSMSALLIVREALAMEGLFFTGIAGLALSVFAFAFRQDGWSRKARTRILSLQPMLARHAAVPILAVVLIAGLLTSVIPTTLFQQMQRPRLMDEFASLFQVPGIAGSEEFSLTEAGYYPLTDQLGGPISLSNTDMLAVKGSPDAYLLKGSVSDRYDGFRWFRVPMQPEYRFNDPLWLDLQNHVFDRNRTIIDPGNPDDPSSSIQPDLTIPLTGWSNQDLHYEVTHLYGGMRSIFQDGRPQSILVYSALPGFQFLDGELVQVENNFLSNAPLYFNQAGAVYQNNPLLTSQRYRIVGSRLQLNQELFDAWYSDRLRSNRSNWINPEEAADQPVVERMYLQLPERVEYRIGGELDQLTQTLTADRTGSYEKAIAIRDYLRDNYRYELDVAIPPQDREFVTWFLEEQEGYCVYFATALTMLCRLAGIPARYVEGFHVPPVEGDVQNPDQVVRVVTGRQAHAWSEIYLEEFGWIVLDATPGGGDAAEQASAEPDNTDAGSDDEPVEPLPTHVPTDPTPTETRPTDPVESDIERPATDIESSDTRFRIEWLFLALIMVLILIVLIHRLLVQKKKQAEIWWLEKEQDPSQRMHMLLQEIIRLLKWQKYVWKTDQTWQSYAEEIRPHLDCSPEWDTLTAVVNELIYGSRQAKEADWYALWRCYPCLLAQYIHKQPKWGKPFRMLRLAIFGQH